MAIKTIALQDSRVQLLKARGTDIRIRSSEALPNSVFDLKRSLEKRGFFVHFAADPKEARQIVTRIAREHKVRKAAKSKSMASEEISLNSALESEGVQVIETDLGEFIVQLAREKPAHILAPAINKKASDVAQLFVETKIANPEEIDPLQPDKQRLTAIARRHLRSVFLDAEMGITGVNFAAAKEGVLVGISNEGNLRMCVSIPPIHVAIVPIEKIVPSLADVATLLPLVTATATGQLLTSYVSLIAGPRNEGEIDGPVESHVVLLDNGRSRLAGTRYEAVLRCVRCGACLNACPVYTSIGGHAYGTTYMGPIGAVLATLIEHEGPSQLPYASSLCGACTEICPVSIPLHEMLYELRADPRHGHQGMALRAIFSGWSMIWDSSLEFRISQSLAARLIAIAAKAGLGKIETEGPGGSSQLVLSNNALGRALKKALRRSEIPMPAPPPTPRIPPPRQLENLRAPAAHQLSASRGNHANESRERMSIDTPEIASYPLSKSPNSTNNNREEVLIETFISNVARNGAEVQHIPSAALPERLGPLLEDIRVATIDPATLNAPYGHSIASLLEFHGIACVEGEARKVASAEIGLATPLLGVASTGSLLFDFAKGRPRLTSLLPPVLVAIVPASSVVCSLNEAFSRLENVGLLSGAALVSGPSKTADIEMTLVTGVHGPGQLWVFVLN
ncbi:MAG: hypothetical protein C4318_01995 [Acidimicrobiia bacterium]